MILFSCSNSRKGKGINKESTTLQWNYSQEDISSLFDRVEYIPLEAHPDGLFKKADKLIVHNNKYYIFDYFGQNQVNVFDKKGDFLYKIGKRGQGPGEYIGIRNFTIKGELVYLIDDMVNKLKIYNADDGSFVEEKILPFYAHDLSIADNGDYLFAQQRIKELHDELPEFQRYNVFITSPDLKIKYNLFPFHEEDCGIRSQLYYFTENEDHIIFHTMVADSIILFDRKSPSNVYATRYIDFGSKKVPRKYENDDEALKNYTYLYGTPNISSKYMIGNYYRTKDYGMNPYIYMGDKEIAFVKNSISPEYFFYPLFSEKDTVYSLYDHAYFDLWEKDNLTPDLPANVLAHLQEGYDVLIKYILK